MKHLHLWVGATAVAALLGLVPDLAAQSADALIDKLVDKGILTVKEAEELRSEAEKDFTRALSAKNGMPEWVTSLKFNGDFRGRYEGFYSPNERFEERHRYRYRLRAGFTAVMLDDFEVGFRLASGDLDRSSTISSGYNPISNNQSFQNNASKKGIFIDLAYAKWSPLHTERWQGALTIGKMENPLVFSDLIFDSDYTPEGAAQQLSYHINSDHALKLNLGQFVLDELSASPDDPWLFASQLRLESAWNHKWSSSLGVAWLSVQHAEQLTSAAVPDIQVGNTRVATRNATGTYTLGAPTADFYPVVVDGALTYTFESAPLHTGPFPVRVAGEYITNPGADIAADGWSVGLTLGKAGKKRTWELAYRYKRLEGDAWWEEFTDSNTGAFYQDAGPVPPAPAASTLRAPGSGYGCGTNVKGHVVKAGYSPLDHVTINLYWYGFELIEAYRPGTESFTQRFQADVVLKF